MASLRRKLGHGLIPNLPRRRLHHRCLRSLRSRLLAWYALVLVAVLVTFAAVAVWTVWRSALQDLDTRLTARARLLARAIDLDAAGQYEVNLTDPNLAKSR